MPETAGLKWYNPEHAPFALSGLAFYEKEGLLRRLPAASDYVYSPGVEDLSWNTSGVQIRFSARLRSLRVRASLRGYSLFDHMTFIGKCGIDCYVSAAGESRFRYYSSLRSEMSDKIGGTLIELDCSRDMEILLNLPLYCGVHELLLGLDADAVIQPPVSFGSNRRAVFYGTSITQGGCASRPGMSYTNILSRMLNVECINLGFSGNGKGEPEIARTIAAIERIGILVLDYEANCDYSRVADTLPEFISIIRQSYPAVPVLVLSRIPFARDLHDPAQLAARVRLRELQRGIVEELRSSGDRNMHFMDGADLYDPDCFEEMAVDGVHPTDLGFMSMARALCPVIENRMFRG